jgi:UDP-hydrolysing UDP-N-acetyl-D-glucosamine 2-epimerase
MRTIGVVTVGRSDYGIYLPILRRLQTDPDLSYYLLVSGMHLSPEYGLTVKQIEEDGFDIGARIESLLSSDTPQGITKSIGMGVMGFGQAYAHIKPDLLLVLGDRYEMYAAALAALPFRIPLAHIHGGEISQGAIDDALRHSLTKLSHLHFAATQQYAERIQQMGEDSWRVVVSGAPALDNLETIQLLSRQELERQYQLDLGQPFVLVTFHPVTLEYEQIDTQIMELLNALHNKGIMTIFTKSNADTGSHSVDTRINDFIRNHPNTYKYDNLGLTRYWSFMALGSAMIGNSSSGIIEAPSFELPVVNIGNRQKGRTRAMNVIDVDCHQAAITTGIDQALSPVFKASLRGLVNPYRSTTSASQIIVDTLKQVNLDSRLYMKTFIDIPGAGNIQ